jgi:RHS repeat-associated protein
LNNVNYDFNGNITNLSRNGWKSNNTFGLVDNLAHTYNSNSNKILKVDDASNETASFKDVSGNDYGYNLDGSLNADANKGITLMEYNYLKLPRKIVQNGVTTLYQYASNGAKLREIISTDTSDYLGNIIKKNGILYQISHDEGRVINGEYEYNIKDHLGNLRIAFRDSLGIAKITQANSYGIFGEDLTTLSYYKSTWKQNSFRQTGKELLQGTGYTDFGARLYDNLVPRFISIDPHVEKYESISPFSYCFDNPIKFLDIKGNDPGDVVILFSGAYLNSFDKEPYGITTQIKNRLINNSNGAKVEKFLSNYIEGNETGSPEFPIVIEQDFDKLTQEAYDYIKANLEKHGRVAIYGYSWGGVLATYLTKRLKKENIDVGNLILIDAADGPFSDQVDRNISDNVDNFVNVYQETKSGIRSRGYPATKQSSKTKGVNVKVSYVRDKSGKFVNASHSNVDDDSLQGVVNNLINFLNSQSDENAKK